MELGSECVIYRLVKPNIPFVVSHIGLRGLNIFAQYTETKKRVIHLMVFAAFSYTSDTVQGFLYIQSRDSFIYSPGIPIYAAKGLVYKNLCKIPSQQINSKCIDFWIVDALIFG